MNISPKHSSALLSISPHSWNFLQHFWEAEAEQSLSEKFQSVNALIKQAHACGALPLKDPLLGIETPSRMARILKNVRESIG